MPGRKVRDEAEARRLLDAVSRSGLGRAVWARQHGINARSLNAWRLVIDKKDRKAGSRRGPSPELTFLELVPTASGTPSALALSVHVGDVRIEVPADFAEDHLRRTLQAVLAAC